MSKKHTPINALGRAIISKHGSLVAFSIAFGISDKTLTCWVRGRNKPKPGTQLLIAEFLGMSIGELFNSEEDDSNEDQLNA